jgi:hypothetical protein
LPAARVRVPHVTCCLRTPAPPPHEAVGSAPAPRDPKRGAPATEPALPGLVPVLGVLCMV